MWFVSNAHGGMILSERTIWPAKRAIRVRPASSSIRLIGSLLVAVVLAVTASSVDAQGVGAPEGSDRIEGRFKLLPIPYVNYSRSIGLQGGALPMIMFNPVASDTESPSSLGGLFGMYSTNDSWFVTAFSRLYLAQDDWRITAAGGAGNYNFQFYVDSPIDDWIPYNSEAVIGLLKVQRRIVGRLYGGVTYVHVDFETTTEVAPGVEEDTRDGLGFDLVLDRRSNVRYPRQGFETTAKYFTYPSAFGNEASSSKTELESNHFFGVREGRDVFAARAFAGFGLGEVSFNQQFVVGQGEDIRGYTQGEYRGDTMIAVQGEYRLNLAGRLGLVGFAGIATVFGAINEDDDGTLLPGIGTGLRFTADTETNLNVGLDIAWGRGDWGIYFKFGEAF